LAAVVGLGAYGLIATGKLDALMQPKAAAPATAPSGTIDVTVTPNDAQIFQFVGRGPAVARDLTVGAAHEFIVFDQGLEPSRAQVAAGASWTTTESGPLYELAVQARPTASQQGAADLGVPQSTTTASEASTAGTIRVITNPPGAKVYRFVGIGPTASIAVASIHEGQELLVYHPGHEIRRAVVGPSDWVEPSADAGYAASLEVQLPAKPQSEAAEAVED
jgi:hypothetical protein